MSRGGNGREGAHFASIDEAIREIAGGRFVIVVDDEDRENEGERPSRSISWRVTGAA